jgi:hypothetical protein
MIFRYVRIAATVAVLSFTLETRPTWGQYAVEVISYNAGTTPASGFTNSSAALGEPERFTGEGVFPGVVSPFNPPFRPNEIVSIGEGGQITLRLSNFAVAQSGGLPEIGVFESVGIADTNYPNGQAGDPAAAFGPDSAVVEVSANGATWFSVGNILFDVPANGYIDLSNPFSSAPGSDLSDFQQPFVGSLSSFNGLPYSHPSNFDMLDLLGGSGGGKWLDISSAGLAQIGYIRFSVPDDGTPTNQNFELDAVSISHAAFGGPTVPEPSASTLVIILAFVFVTLVQPHLGNRKAESHRTLARTLR